MFAQIVLRLGQGTRDKGQGRRTVSYADLGFKVDKCVLRFDGWCRGIMDDECHDEKRESERVREIV